MDGVIAGTLSKAPEVLISLSIIFLIIYVLREYRKIRQETEQSIQSIVNGKLGEIMSSLQTEIARLNLISKEQETKILLVDSNYQRFMDALEEKSAMVNQLYSEASEKLATLREAIPDVEEFSARDILNIARSKNSPQAKAELCKQILCHPDATSLELEVAGDMMREIYRYHLAKDLYEKAHEMDPERTSAYVELLALSAKTDYVRRKDAFNIAKGVLINRPDTTGVARIADTLIFLNYYEELAGFCDDIIEAIGNRNRDVKVIALRNKAVALKEMGHIDESLATYQLAFSIEPDNENTLRAYLSLLEEQGKYEEYLSLSKKLINLDPSDINYYRIYISALFKSGMYDEAEKWLKKTEIVPKSAIDEETLKSYELKIRTAVNVTVNSEEEVGGGVA